MAQKFVSSWVLVTVLIGQLANFSYFTQGPLPLAAAGDRLLCGTRVTKTLKYALLWKKKWRLELLGALRIMDETALFKAKLLEQGLSH